MVVFFVFASMALADMSWVTANQVSVAWDKVTKSADGTVTFPDGQITYAVYIANSVTDPNKTNPVKVATVPGIEYTFTLNTEGRFLAGVSAIRTVDGNLVGESAISWSDEQANAFGVQFYMLPPAPSGLKPK